MNRYINIKNAKFDISNTINHDAQCSCLINFADDVLISRSILKECLDGLEEWDRNVPLHEKIKEILNRTAILGFTNCGTHYLLRDGEKIFLYKATTPFDPSSLVAIGSIKLKDHSNFAD